MLDISAAATATSPNPDRFRASRLTFGSSNGTSSFSFARTASMLYGSFVRDGVAPRTCDSDIRASSLSSPFGSRPSDSYATKRSHPTLRA